MAAPDLVLPQPPKRKPKGRLIVKIASAKGLPRADTFSIGPCDPYVVVSFCGQEKQTSVKKRTKDPTWNEELKFDIYEEEGEMTMRVFDYDTAGKDDPIAEAPAIRMGGSAGSEGYGPLQLRPPRELADDPKARLKGYGELQFEWHYTYSAYGDLFGSAEDPEEEDDDMDLAKLMGVACKLAGYGYSGAYTFFGCTDLLMWSRPFASAGCVLFLLVAMFASRNLLECSIPSAVAVVMLRSWFMRLRYGMDWDQQGELPICEMPTAHAVPAARLRRTMPVFRELVVSPSAAANPIGNKRFLKLAYVWCTTAVSALDRLSDVITWRDEAAARAITYWSVFATAWVFLFGVPWALVRVGTVLALVSLQIMIPGYYYFPNMRDPAQKRISGVLNTLNAALGGALDQVRARLPPALGGKGPVHLPPVPAEQRPYSEWKQFHDDREKTRQRYGIGTPRTGPGAAAAAVTTSNLRVEVMNARNLPPQIASHCPFVKMTLKTGHKFKTRPAESPACEWNIAFTFRGLPDSALRSALTIELQGPISAPRLLAVGLLGSEAIGAASDLWLPLCLPGDGSSCGELRICLKLERGLAPSAFGGVASPGTAPATSPVANQAATAHAAAAAASPPPAGGAGGGDVAAEADALLERKDFDAVYRLLEGAVAASPGDGQLQWRFARACYDCGGELQQGPEQESYYKKGQAAALKSQELLPDRAEPYKWSAILTSKCGDYLPTKEKLSNAFKVKDWAKKAADLDPKDGTTQHVLGAWHFNVAGLGWAAKKIAGALFGTPPEATYQEALPFLHKSHELSPLHSNALMLGDCYSNIGQKDEAKKWWKVCVDLPATTQKEKGIQAQARKKL